ncbi:MAG: TolC family protein [Marinifilaceae bacterium]
MKYKILIIFTLFSFGVFAQESLSLEDAITKGLTNNYSVVAINKLQNISELNNSWGKAGAFPFIDFKAGYSYSIDNDDFDRANIRALNAGVNLNWTLFNGFAIRINKEKLATLNDLSKGNTSVLVENTIQEIIIAYYNSLLQDKKLDVSLKLFNLSKDRYEKAKSHKSIGTSGVYQVLQAKNSYLEDKSKLLLQKSVYNNSIRDLNLLMGENSEKRYMLISSFVANNDEYILANLLDRMKSSNNVLKNQYLALNINEMEILLAKSIYYPRLGVTAGASYIDSNMDYRTNADRDNTKKILSAGLNLSYTLFNGGNNRRAVRIAKLQKEIGEIKKEEILLKLSNTMASALEMYNVRKQMYILADENMKTAELNLKLSLEKFNTGVISSFNYRDVQMLYLNASISRLNSIYMLIGANTYLVKLTGGLLRE